MSKILIIGSGSFGTALSVLLSAKGNEVSLWGRNASFIEGLAAARENTKYLPGVRLDEEIACVSGEEKRDEILASADAVVFSVPAQNFRAALEDVKGVLPKEAMVINVAKGIEKDSLMLLSEIAEEVVPGIRYVALSGPSHAEEVGRGLPTTVAVASYDKRLADRAQDLFMTNRFRVYTRNDLAGVELGGALKNIIALGAGMSDGIGFGDNAKAALMTRGMAEMTRLGIAMGARPDTFAGLTGMGDLIVTCTSMHSRNRRCGILIGQGKSADEAAAEVGMVVEGISTAIAADALAKKHGVEMPITEHICKVISGEESAKSAVEILMTREKKHE